MTADIGRPQQKGAVSRTADTATKKVAKKAGEKVAEKVAEKAAAKTAETAVAGATGGVGTVIAPAVGKATEKLTEGAITVWRKHKILTTILAITLFLPFGFVIAIPIGMILAISWFVGD